MKTVLFPTDFSPCATNAFAYALELASLKEAEVVVLHVVYPNEGVDNNVYSAFWTDDYLAQREKGLNDWIRRKTAKSPFKNVRIRPITQIGFPVGTVTEVAEGVDADLIVMGTTGATGMRGALLGSVAAGVMAKTKRPVFVVPKKARFSTMRDVVMATDFQLKLSDTSKNLLKTWLQLHQSRLHVVHIVDKPGEHIDKAREKAFADKLGYQPHDFHYLHDRDVTQAISNFLEAVDAQAVVAIAHEHSLMHRLFFDSITRKLAHRVQKPLLALHDA